MVVLWGKCMRKLNFPRILFFQSVSFETSGTVERSLVIWLFFCFMVENIMIFVHISRDSELCCLISFFFYFSAVIIFYFYILLSEKLISGVILSVERREAFLLNV